MAKSRNKVKGDEMSAATVERNLVWVDPAEILDTRNLGRYKEKPPEHRVDELAASIKEYGQEAPVRLRKSKTDPNKFEPIFGFTRIAACRKLGRNVLAEITDDNDETALLRSIEENFRRGEVNVIDAAFNMAQLKKLKWKQKDIAKHFGYTDARVSQLLKLLELPAPVIDAICADQLSATAAFQLCELKPDQIQSVMEAAWVTFESAKGDPPIEGKFETAKILNGVQRIKQAEAPPTPPATGDAAAPTGDAAATTPGDAAATPGDADAATPGEPGKKELKAALEAANETIARFAPLSVKLNAVATTVSNLSPDVREMITCFAKVLTGGATVDDVILAAAKVYGFDPNAV